VNRETVFVGQIGILAPAAPEAAPKAFIMSHFPLPMAHNTDVQSWAEELDFATIEK
jgi:hypothetical protein